MPLLQTAAAAGIAWFLAEDVLGHKSSAFFAPVAAVIALGFGPGKHTRRAVERVVGVAVGILVGDALISVIGRGPGQVALVVLLAMSGAILLGGGSLVVSQAASSAVLVATIVSTSHGLLPTRFVDALVGGLVGLAVLVVAPRNPVKLVQRASRPVFVELAAVLDDVAAALEVRDLDAMERALSRARATDGLLAALREALSYGEETVRLAPTQWSERGRVQRYALAAPQVEFAMRNARVLARAGVRAVELEPKISESLIAAIRHLSLAARPAREHARASTCRADAARASTLKGAREATLALEEGMGFAIDVLVGQARSIATDLLRALGVEDAVDQIRSAADYLRDIEPGVFEVEIALDAVHDVVVDAALAAEVDDCLSFGVEHFASQALVVLGLLLDAAVVFTVEARGEAIATEDVGAAHPLERLLSDPILAGELVEASEGCLRGVDPGLRLFLRSDTVVLEAEQPDQERERQALEDEGGEDRAEDEVDDEVALRERCASRQSRVAARAPRRATPLHGDPPSRSALELATADRDRARGCWQTTSVGRTPPDRSRRASSGSPRR